MYELKQLGEKTYYIECPTKIGIYKINDKDVYLIDSGNDKEMGKKILKILTQEGWNLVGIINTHSNADHIGGNALLQERTNCKIMSKKLENTFIEYPYLESSFLYGGYPHKGLRSKFLCAKPSKNVEDIKDNLPEGLEIIDLPGHYMDMIGIRTSDNICFIADSVFSDNTIQKYHIFFIYDLKGFLNTLNKLEELHASYFVPSHAEVVTDIKPIVSTNRDKIEEIINVILDKCKEEIGFEELLKELFDYYSLTLDFNQYVLVGSTVKSYLSYLIDEGKMQVSFKENRLYWKSI